MTSPQAHSRQVSSGTENPPFPIQDTSSEGVPRVPVRPMDIENWKTEVTDLAREMPKFDPYTATFFGISIGNIVAIISLEASVENPNLGLVRLLWGLAIIAAIATVAFAWRTRNDKDRHEKRAERLCSYMDKCQRKLEKQEG